MSSPPREIDSFASRLREVIDDAGDTLEDAAQRVTAEGVKVGKGSVSHWQTGKHRPDYDKLEAFCRAYDINPAWLIAGEPPKRWSDVGGSKEEGVNEAVQRMRETLDSLEGRYSGFSDIAGRINGGDAPNGGGGDRGEGNGGE